ncbi:MAG: hypothetical protein WCS33_01325 [Candidatus Caldatribacteriota bacterium]|jgi:hypothetical protein
MGLAESIQNAISSGMKAFDNVRKLVTYHSSGTTSYNPSTGTTSETGAVDIENLYVTFTSYKLDDIDNETIHKEDKKVLIPAIDISVVPKETDYLLTENETERWDVKNKKIDPAGAMWVLQVRMHEEM